jgi:pimeloyl-ACP methyl ester carboxylesterase
VFDFLDHENIDSVDLLGTSHGGAVAVTMAATRPERIKNLILVAPVNPWSKHGLWITKILATKLGRLGFEKLTPAIEALSQMWVNRLYGDPGRVSPGTVEGYRAPSSLPGSWTYGLDIIKHWHSDLRLLADDYGRISQPTLLMWGDKDIAVYSSSAEEIKKRIPHAKLELFSGVGHLPYEEVPEEFNRTLLKFLQ